jgi:uncharacterized protein (DUF433 family)
VNWRERIVIDAAVHHGDPCIKGTRVPVSVIVGSIADGDTAQQILVDRFRINVAMSPLDMPGWRRPSGHAFLPGVTRDRRPKGLRQPVLPRCFGIALLDAWPQLTGEDIRAVLKFAAEAPKALASH